MRLSRRLIAGFAAATLSAAGGAAAQPLPTRVYIDLLYARSTDPTLEQHVNQWASSLHEKLQNSLAWDTSLGLPAAGRIQVTPAPQPSFPTAVAMEQRWRNRNAIQIVFGHGSRSAGVSEFEGNIYLGDLHGRLPLSVPIRQDINGGAFERSSDFVLVVALYALSVDAARVRVPTSCRLLHRAAVLGQALPAALVSAAPVKAAIQADLSSRCGGRGS